jgi:acyl-ACP thioesterase
MAGTYRYRVEPHDIDATLRARTYSMGDIVLRAANDDADMLGFGVRDLNVSNSSWVLSRMAVEMRRIPSRHEDLDIYTWVSDYGRMVTTRNMTVADAQGAEIGAAVTQWAMIDLASRRPLDLSALSNKATSLVDREPSIEKPRKVAPFECTAERLHVVVYSDIDFNGHVNSMKYLEWMTDTMPASALTGATGFRFDINYVHEAKLGEALAVCYAETNDTHSFDIRNSDGLSICKATIQIYN